MKLFRYIKRLLYALPFSMKAEEAILSDSGRETGGQTINVKQEQKNVFKDLLNGEITQEVVDMRYSTYKVADESKKYHYVGGGVAEKKAIKRKSGRHYHFTQRNHLIVSGILDELKHLDDYGEEKYLLNISYNRFTRFKTEAYVTYIDVDIHNDDCYTTLHFDGMPNPYNAVSMPFINELRKINNESSKIELDRNEIVNTISSMEFITENASDNQEDLWKYTFSNPTFISFFDDCKHIEIKYKWDAYDILNLKEKFFSQNMQDKYDRKERKNNFVNFSEEEKDETKKAKIIDIMSGLKNDKNSD